MLDIAGGGAYDVACGASAGGDLRSEEGSPKVLRSGKMEGNGKIDMHVDGEQHVLAFLVAPREQLKFSGHVQRRCVIR